MIYLLTLKILFRYDIYRKFFVIVGVLFIVILYIKVYKEEKFWVLYLMTVTGLLYLTVFGWLIVIIEPKEKSCLEYLRGNLEVKYEKVYVDSMLVRTDTIIEFKKR